MASFGRLLIAVIALGMSAAAAQAQSYPTRPIKLIVPFPPGGPVDVMARVVAQRLSAGLGQVIVDNRPGAGGTLGSRAAAMAEPDGYTLLFGSSTTLAGPALYRNPGYDPVTSLVPVGMINSKEAAESLARLGAEPKFGTPESFGAVIAAEIPKWAETVRAAGVRLD